MSRPLRSSDWAVHPGHGIGRIHDILADGYVTFERFRHKSGDAAPALDHLEPVRCWVADLRLCRAAELPASLELTAEQLRELGYA